VDQKLIEMDKATMKEIVYIENCSNCGVMIKGKVKAIMLSNCKKISLMFNDVVSTVEAVRCSNLTIQAKLQYFFSEVVNFSAPSISLDNCQYVKIYLATNLETDIISTKVTELNVSYIEKDDEYAVIDSDLNDLNRKKLPSPNNLSQDGIQKSRDLSQSLLSSLCHDSKENMRVSH
jgi:adenylyl cyclase-associated protein